MKDSRVGLFAAIRRDARDGLSKRALQRKYGVGFRTVAAALDSAWPAQRKDLPARSSRLDPFKGVIDGWLRDDLKAPRKQRHTVVRIHQRLLDEQDAVDVSYGMVRAYVSRRVREIRAEAGLASGQVFIPQAHLPGQDAEVDFGDVMVRLAGEAVTCTMFCLRLSYFGKAVHRVSASAGQEAFFEGTHTRSRSLAGSRRGRSATTT